MKITNPKSARRLLSLALAVVMTLSLAACGEKPESSSSDAVIESSSSLPSSSSSSSSSSTSSSSSSSTSSSSSGSSSTGAGTVVPETRAPKDIQKDILTKMVSAHGKNEDVVGWMYVPGTTINEPVVQTIDNEYYLRRDWQTKENFYGCYYADYRAPITTREKLPKNTVVYGHNTEVPTDNPDGVKFAQLNKYQDKKFTEEHQFIYFSTPESEMVWQIFAVFDTTVDFYYHNVAPSDADYLNIIKGARNRSKYNFDVKVSNTDKILTLSTCTYRYTGSQYPNPYRYVVMAKLLDKGAAQTPAKVENNPSIAKP